MLLDCVDRPLAGMTAGRTGGSPRTRTRSASTARPKRLRSIRLTAPATPTSSAPGASCRRSVPGPPAVGSTAAAATPGTPSSADTRSPWSVTVTG